MRRVNEWLCVQRIRTMAAFTALWLGVLLCCAGQAQAQQLAVKQTPAWQVVQQYVAAWNAHDPRAATQLLATDVTYVNTSAPGVRQGRQSVFEVVDGLLRLIPDLRWQVVGAPVAEDAGVAFEWEFSGSANVPDEASHTTRMRPIRLRGASFARIEQGRIVYFADYYNGLAMQKQLAP